MAKVKSNDGPPDLTSHDSAFDRTLMAEERTFSAWMRSGMAAIGAAVAIVKLVPNDGAPPWLVQSLGVVLIVAGGMAFAFGFWGYRAGARYWTAALPRAIPLWLMAVFTGLLMVAALLALYIVLLP
mgnify:CR=1 FL=1